MPIVKVWNDNVHPHTERFHGESVTIPARGFIEMEYEEAMALKGQFTGIAPEAEGGGPDPRFFKMIRVEQPPPETVCIDDGLTNHATGKKAATLDDLMAGLKALAAADPTRVVRDAEAERAAAAKADEIIVLRAEIAELKELITGIAPKKAGKTKKED